MAVEQPQLFRKLHKNKNKHSGLVAAKFKVEGTFTIQRRILSHFIISLIDLFTINYARCTMDLNSDARELPLLCEGNGIICTLNKIEVFQRFI